MKRFFLPVLFALLLPLAACDSGGDGDGDGPGSIPSTPSDNRVTWRAGGASYEAEGDGTNQTSGAATGRYVASGAGGQGQLFLNAIAVQDFVPSNLVLSANGVSGEGTYTLSLSGNGTLASFTRISGTTATNYVAETVQLTVSALTDTGMSGRFSFDAAEQGNVSNTISVSDGTFSVAFDD